MKKLKKFLHTFFKIFAILMAAMLLINLIIFTIIYFNHKSKLKDEAANLVAPGKMVDVGGYEVHIEETGDLESDITIVFLHNTATVDDSIAIQPLFSELDEYHCVYLDRSGFGFSDGGDGDKDIDSIIEEMRTALANEGIKAPYILMGCGTGGLYATYWAKEFPEEVTSIIGLNMNYAEQYDGITKEQYCGFFNYLLVKFNNIGGHRLAKSVFPSDDFAIFTDRQMAIRNAITGKSYYTKSMYAEDLATIDNVAIIKEEGFAENVPIYNIISNPFMEPYVNEDEETREAYEDAVKEDPDFDYVAAYNETKLEYWKQYENVTIDEMAGPGRIYLYNPKGVSENITQYIENELLQ